MQRQTSKPARNRRAVWAAGAAVLAVTALIVGVGFSDAAALASSHGRATRPPP